MNVRAIVVDDERLARNRLRRMLDELGVDVIAEGENGRDAVELAQKLDADVLVIDINMPKMNGLDAVAELSKQMQHPPSIIFCTAYDEFALKAFDLNATSYLLKPVNSEKLQMAISQARALSAIQVKALQSQMSTQDKLAVNVEGSIENIKLDEILFFKSHEKHVYAVLKDQKNILVGYTLKQLEKKLTAKFVRAHRNSLVAINKLSSLTRDDNGAVVLHLEDTTETIIVSRRHVAEVKQCFR